MAGRERLGGWAALSRLPRWLTVLGIVLVLAVLAGIAALLATGNSALRSRLGPTVTVVLKVDGEPAYLLQWPYIACNAHGGRCSPPADTGTVTYTTPTGGKTYQYTALPSTRKVQVPVGGVVTLDASSDVDVVGCWILLNGKVLSQT